MNRAKLEQLIAHNVASYRSSGAHFHGSTKETYHAEKHALARFLETQDLSFEMFKAIRDRISVQLLSHEDRIRTCIAKYKARNQ